MTDNTFTVAGRTVAVKHFTIKEAPDIIMASLPFIDQFDEAVRLREKQKQDFTTTHLYRVVAKNIPVFIGLCEKLTDADRAWIESLEPKDFFNLATYVIVANGDFFLAQLVEPLIKLANQAAQAGKHLSNDLSAQGMVLHPF